MKEYKITYSGESEGYRLITDITEAAAKKYFREVAKETDMGRVVIESVELVSDKAMATKRNERDTLEAIRQMVADLGEQSYLATAFEGCFEIAEQNIENDFADSMKGRLECAEREVERLRDKVNELAENLEKSEEKHRGEIGEVQELRHSLERAHKATEGLEELEVTLCERAEDAEHKAAEAAERIVKYADNPDSEEFKAAVREHRSHLEFADYNKLLAGRVSGYTCEAHAGA